MENDEQELLQRVAGGDRDAVRELLQQHGPRVRDRIDRDIGQVWRSVLDADDVMQVTYLEAFLHQESLAATTAAGFESWLRKIAVNNLRDAVKELGRQKRPHPAQRVHQATPHGDSYVTLIHVLSDGGETPSRHVARDEAAEAVQSLLKRLPVDYAQVIQLYDLESRPISDVANAMGRSAGAVHMLRSRAHDQMRALVGHETDFFSRTA